MIHRIEVGFKTGVTDALGESVARSVEEDLGLKAGAVRTVAVYTTNLELPPEQLDRLGRELFADPVIQRYSVDRPLDGGGFDWLLEIGYRPGITDNVGHTASQGARDMLGVEPGPGQGFFTSRQYLFQGRFSREDIERVAQDLLANGLIERWQIISRQDWKEGRRLEAVAPVVSGGGAPGVAEYDLEVSNRELVRISEKGLLSLTLEEMQAIQAYFRRADIRERRVLLGLGTRPTDVELECIAQTWSEHCKHKIFNCLIDYSEADGNSERIDSLFKTYVRRATSEIAGRTADWLISVFHDNAGVIAFDERWGLAMKVETHNSPSALDPYGGAITGIVGVNRDILGTGIGCRMIFNTDVFCFARPDYDKPLEGKLLHPKRIFKGVHRGVRDGGNQSGIPTVNGAIVFDDRFRGKPLVFCGTGGIIPRRVAGRPSHEKVILPGDHIVMIGGRIGKDGIHGATFSSLELDENSPASAVQIGDPITQKKMADCLIEARDAGLVRTLTDNGAGGLSSSVGELARLSGGAELHLERAPLKYPGLAPWEILLSEAQERMSVVVAPENLADFLELCRRREVEATDLGHFTASGIFHVLYEGRTVGALELAFLHDGLPKMQLSAHWRKPEFEEPQLPPASRKLDADLLKLLGRYNVCSKEAVVRQYDHEVQALTVVKPFAGLLADGPSDASVIKPLPGSRRGVVVGCGIVPRYSDLDTYAMAACAVDEAVRNVVATGARPDRIAGLDNFCWPDPVQSEKTPDGAYKLAQLVRACRALYDYCSAYSVPCISGKDSMKNDYGGGRDKISIPPTLLFTAIGAIDDVSRAVTVDFKRPGDLVYIVGESFEELGGSEYFAMLGAVGNRVPAVDAGRNRAIFELVHRAITERLVASCHDLSDGGLGVALAECCIAGCLGVEIDLSSVPGAQRFDRDDLLLFSESQGRFLLSVSREHRADFERLLTSPVAGACVGEVTDDGLLKINSASVVGGRVVELPVESLRKAWKEPLDW